MSGNSVLIVGATAPLDQQILQGLRQRIAAAGRTLPDPSMKCIEWRACWAGWRVQLPRFCGGKQIYFSHHNYGGAEAALIEAQYFRDEAFKAAGVGLYEPIRPTKKRRDRGQVLPVAETYDPRRNHYLVVGYWMETINGERKQRRISRVIGKRTREELWAEVEEIVRRKVSEEAQRRQRLEQPFLS